MCLCFPRKVELLARDQRATKVCLLWGVKLWLFMNVCGGARVVQLFSIDTESLNVETAAGPQFPRKPRQGEGKLPILIGSLSAV